MASAVVPAAPTGWRAALVPGLLALLAALVVVGVGLASYGGHISRFVHAGTWYVTARPHLVRQPGAGYDGQFIYRLALAPLNLATRAHGIAFDTPLRTQRIGLPLLGWLLSAGGRPAALPYVLLGIEVLSVAVLGALGGLVAARARRAPAWGVLLASPVGLVFAVLHDLTEPPAVALLVAGLLLLQAGRPVWAGTSLAAAALTRETALVVVLAIALPRVWAVVRGRRSDCPDHSGPGRSDLSWVLPVAVWAGWEAYVMLATHRSPLTSGGKANLAPPLAGVVGLAHALPHAALHQWPLLVVQLAVTAYLLLAAAPAVRTAAAPLPLAVLLSGAFVLLLSTVVWTGYDNLRFLAELTALALLALLASRRPLRGVAIASAAVWVLSLALNRF